MEVRATDEPALTKAQIARAAASAADTSPSAGQGEAATGWLLPDAQVVATKDLLALFAKGSTRLEYLQSVQQLIRRWTGCPCIGIRLLDPQNRIPYECYTGFGQSFWEEENWLSIERDVCACIRVIQGAFEPQDAACVTPNGSFACNDATRFAESLTDEQRRRFRGLCAAAGYRSVAIVPIRYGDRIMGAIHVADTRPGTFPRQAVEFIEAMAPLIGEAVHRFNVEDSLRQTNELLEGVFESIGLNVAYMDSDFRFIRVNRRYAAADGRTPEFFPGKKHFDWYPNAENEEIFRRVVRTGEPYFVFAKPFVYAEHPERGVTYWDWSLQPVRHPDGTVSGVVLCLIDVTDRKRAQEALQQKETLLRAVFDQTFQFIAILDTDGRTIECNDTATRLFGDDELTARLPFWKLAAWGSRDTRHRIRHAIGRAADGHLVRYQVELVDRDKNAAIIDFSLKPVRDQSGTVTCLLAEGRDITESKRLEKQVLAVAGREQRRIGQDLHDVLGQHLTGIAFLLRVLQQGLAGKSLPEAEEAQRISELLKQAIVQARGLARGLCPIDQKEDGLMNALQSFAANVQAVYGVTCRFECDRPVLVGDISAATHLYYIAQEAVTNAMKHGNASRITIRLADEDDACVLGVRDNGVGIPDQPARGRGIGLSIMGYRAGMIGGTLTVSRHPEGGTVATCSWQQPKVPRRPHDGQTE